MLVCHVPYHTRQHSSTQRYGHGLCGGSQGDRHCSMQCLIPLLRPGITTRLTPYAVASGSGSALTAAPAPALGGSRPTALGASTPLREALGTGQELLALAPYRPARPCPYPPAGCRSGCGQPDDAGGSRGWSRCCGPSANASAWPRLPNGASRSAPCWARLHVRPRPAPPFRFRRQPPSSVRAAVREGRVPAEGARSGVGEAQRGRAQSGQRWETQKAPGQPPAGVHQTSPYPSRGPVKLFKTKPAARAEESRLTYYCAP